MRKFLTALVAVAAIGAMAVATSSTADARWAGGYGWRGGWGWGPGPFVAGALIGGALLGGALAAPYYYGGYYPYGGYGPYYPMVRIPMAAAAGCGTAITGCAPVTKRQRACPTK